MKMISSTLIKKINKLIEKYQSNNKKIVLLFLGIIFIIYFILAYLSKGSFGGGDTYYHYRFSRYCLNYPLFLLDLWAKPVFTLLSMPFSQFGYLGIKTGNILFGLIAAYYTFLIADFLKYKNSWFALLPVIFAPIYIALMFTAMTEVLFSLFLIVGIYYSLKDKYLVAAIIVSFIPFVRSEGWVVILLFGFVFLINKKFRYLPLLLIGTLIYSIIGYFVFNDFIWIFNQHPYLDGAKNLYGSGSFFFYVKRVKYTFGLILTALILFGILYFIITLLKNKIFKEPKFLNQFLLIFGSFAGIFFLHSFLWYKGLMSVLADDRFIAGIVPVTGLVGLAGLNFILGKIKNKSINELIFGLVTGFVIITPFKIYKFPIQPDGELEVIIESADWLKETEYFNNKIFYYHGAYPILLSIDPYDTLLCQEKVFDTEIPEYNLPDKSIVVWDAHYSANEGNLKLEKLINNKNFQIIQIFNPKVPFQVLGDNKYQVIVFQKTHDSSDYKIDTIGFKYFNFSQNQDIEIEDKKEFLVTKNDSLLLKLNKENKFSPVLNFLCDDKTFRNYKYNAKIVIYSDKEIINKDIFIVFSIEKNNNTLFYQTKKLDTIKSNEFLEFDFSQIINESDFFNGKISVYLWNNSKEEIYIKDLKVSYTIANE